MNKDKEPVYISVNKKHYENLLAIKDRFLKLKKKVKTFAKHIPNIIEDED